MRHGAGQSVKGAKECKRGRDGKKEEKKNRGIKCIPTMCKFDKTCGSYLPGFVCNLYLHIAVSCFFLASKGSSARKESFSAKNIFFALMIK